MTDLTDGAPASFFQPGAIPDTAGFDLTGITAEAQSAADASAASAALAETASSNASSTAAMAAAAAAAALASEGVATAAASGAVAAVESAATAATSALDAAVTAAEIAVAGSAASAQAAAEAAALAVGSQADDAVAEVLAAKVLVDAARDAALAAVTDAADASVATSTAASAASVAASSAIQTAAEAAGVAAAEAAVASAVGAAITAAEDAQFNAEQAATEAMAAIALARDDAVELSDYASELSVAASDAALEAIYDAADASVLASAQAEADAVAALQVVADAAVADVGAIAGVVSSDAATAAAAAAAALADADRAEIAAADLRSEPLTPDPAFAVVDEEGNTALEITGDASTFKAAGTTVRRNVDDSIEIERGDGAGLSLKLTSEGLEVGGSTQVDAPDGVMWAVGDDDGFTAIAVREGEVSVGGVRIVLEDSDAGVALLSPSGARFYEDASGLAGLRFEQVDRDDIEVGWADDEGFIALATRADGSMLGTGFSAGGGGGDAGDAEYSDAEIAARNASNLAYSAGVARTGNTTAQRPTAAYNHILIAGQSLALGSEGWPSLTNTPPYGGNLTIGLSVHRGGAYWTGFVDNDFHPLQARVCGLADPFTLLDATEQAALTPGDDPAGETPLEAALTFLRRSWNNHYGVEDDLTRKFVGSCVARGGQTIAELSKPSFNWDRVTACATLAKATATGLSATYSIPAVLFMQGENDYGDGTTKEDYKAGVKQYVADLRSDVQVAIAGQTKPFLFVTYQTSGRFLGSYDQNLAVSMGQLELALEEPDWIMAGPNYPYTDKDGHLDTNGYRWMGEQFGKVLAKVFVDGQGWQPLRPRSLTKRGREVLIGFHVPEPPLVFDLPYVINTATDFSTKGFAARDDLGDNPISAVEIVADTIVRLTLSRDPVGETRVRYGGKTVFNGNGCLRDSDATVSFFNYEYTAGTGQYASANIPALVDKPYPLHNWGVLFDLPAIDD